MLEFYEDELMVHNIDSDSCVGENIDVAHVADFPWGRLIVTAVIQLRGVHADAGGSVVGEGLILNLDIVARMKED